jgi:hypothetical protein
MVVDTDGYAGALTTTLLLNVATPDVLVACKFSVPCALGNRKKYLEPVFIVKGTSLVKNTEVSKMGRFSVGGFWDIP